MKKISAALVVAVCLGVAPALLESQIREIHEPQSVACASLQFGVGTVTYREGGNTAAGLVRGKPTDITCRKPIDAAALQFIEDASTSKRIPTISLSGQSQLVATLSNAQVSGVQITAENGQGVAEVTFAYQKIELAVGGAHVTVDANTLGK